jgi:molybdenum cofactor cytidylyltransferase
LLAAGRGERFGGDKLLALVPSDPRWRADAPTDVPRRDFAAAAVGECIGVMACRNLLSALPRVVAVVRPDDAALAMALGAAGARIVRCAKADAGMGASLACGVRSTPDAAGWIIALGDMPWIEPATIARAAATKREPSSRRLSTREGAGIRSASPRRASRRWRRSPATMARSRSWRRIVTASCGSTATTRARCATSTGQPT